MKKNLKIYWTLFKSTFYLSAFTFGGGFVIIPLMRKKFVEELGWIEEKEMLDLTAIAQSSPGAIAVNAAIIIGYRIGGIGGALISTLGTILPPFIILSVISFFYAEFRDNAIINALLKGMQAGVVAVIADVVINLGMGIVKERRISSLIIMIGAFVATFFLEVNIIIVILAAALIGLSAAYYRNKHNKDGDEI
ncbi:MAG TPA: chromate transporter [Acholeplasmataceae bacterium]|jgi:chromate transporter|nr:chromate transporter [Acholeplasmataceae bacterium]